MFCTKLFLTDKNDIEIAVDMKQERNMKTINSTAKACVEIRNLQ